MFASRVPYLLGFAARVWDVLTRELSRRSKRSCRAPRHLTSAGGEMTDMGLDLEDSPGRGRVPLTGRPGRSSIDTGWPASVAGPSVVGSTGAGSSLVQTAW